MIKNLRLDLSPEVAFDETQRRAHIENLLKIKSEPWQEKIRKRSIDARGRKVKVRLEVDVAINENFENDNGEWFRPQNVGNQKAVAIIGCGPAGMFAALRLIELGIKPIIIERGKDVRARRRDLAAINKEHVVNPNSNYCFGEGGAGTYSDGKLYTRSKKRGNVKRVLEILKQHGSPEDILVDAHPHIGTNKLPAVVQAIRESIIECGGDVLFETRVEDFILDSAGINGLILDNNTQLLVDDVILATGHSARDIYQLCVNRKVFIEAKPFALGVRVEHPQSVIDQVQYNCSTRGEYLPAASYALVHQTVLSGKQRGVFSFCMCPGGFIVPSATSPGEIVVNGMSPSKRNSMYANSGIVVAIELEDIKGYEKFGPLAAMAFQANIEKKAFEAAGQTQSAPAQRLVDFVDGKVSTTLNDCSYIPGLTSCDLASVLPKDVAQRLKLGFKGFAQKMKPYYTNQANVVGVESRSSAPVRIPRDNVSLEHIKVKGLYPCGEGAGYAGGIVSAAVDGMRCAEAIGIKKGLFSLPD